MDFTQWRHLWRLSARHVPLKHTDLVNPALDESQQSLANQVMYHLMFSYWRDFLTEIWARDRAFSDPCYFFNRALRVPVWVVLHQLVFDVPWAGRFRSYDVSRGFDCDEFCPATDLVETAQRVMHRLRSAAANLGTCPDRDILTSYLAHMHTYLNYVHPFADGNGRLQRLYMNFVAGYYGWLIDWSRVNRDAYADAVRLAFRQDRVPLQMLIGQALVPLNKVER